MAEDRSNRAVEFAHFVAAEVVRHIDRSERPTILVAANAIAGDERARQRFSDALLTEICCELRGVQTSPLDAVFPTMKDKIMPNDPMASLTPSELEAHLAAGQRLLYAKRAEARGAAVLRTARAEIANLTSTASPQPAPASATSPSVTAPARANAPPRPAWTSAQMDERVQRIVQSHWAEGREALAVMLCSSPCSIEEAIGALKASRADTATSQRQDTAAEIFARRRGVALADQPTSSGLNADEIFARRRAAAASRRGTAIETHRGAR